MDSPVKPRLSLRRWVEKRWPVAPVIRWGSVDEFPGGTKFAYVLGSATLALFVVLVITGVWQLLYYVPTVDHAYDSVMFLRLQVPLGWLVHGLHYWAAQAFIVLMGLHMARVFIWAAYKKPRELTWLLGVVLLLLGAALLPAAPARAEDEPIPREVEYAIDHGLEWLAKTQDNKGNWNGTGPTSAAATGLATMAFMARGHTPGQGPYGENVSRGVDAIRDPFG